MTPAFMAVVAFALGAAIGSFLNVCVSRWPAEQSVVSPRSRCPNCERPIRAHENVPIFGWLALGGRCRGCRLPISVQYPAVELGVGLAWVAALFLFGPTFTALRVAVLFTILLGVVLTDAKHYVIPDGFTVFGLIWVLGTAFAALVMRNESMFATPYEALIGAFTGAGVIAVAGWLGEVALGREAMGFGDVTLMAVLGGALGPDRALLTVFIGAALGAVVFLGVVFPVGWLRARVRGVTFELPPIPFGVFLAPAGLIALLFGDALIAWYASTYLA